MNHPSYLKIVSSSMSFAIPSILSYWILGGQFWYIFPPIIGCLSLLFVEYVSSEHVQNLRFSFTYRHSLFLIAYVVVYLISIASIWFLPTANQSLIFLDWFKVPPIEWIRVIISLLLAGFLPGFALLSLIQYMGHSNFSVSATVLFSFLLSALFGGVVAIFSLSLGSFGDIPSNNLVIMIANLLLLFLFCLRYIKRRKDIAENSTKSYNPLELLIIILSIIFTLVAVIVGNLQHTPMLGGDQWRHNGIVSIMLSGQVPSYPGKLFPQISYPFFFYSSLFYTFSLTGLPSANSYALLNIFDPIIVLGIYYAIKSFSSDTKTAVSAAVLSLMAGLGWFLFKLSPSFSIAGWDIFVYPTYLVYWWAIPIGLYALPSILGAIGLIGSPKAGGKSKLVLLGLSLTLGYLMHVFEVAIFIVILALVLFIYSKSVNISNKDLWFVSLILVAFTLAVEILSPVKGYIFATKFSTISPVIVGVGTIPFVFMLLKSAGSRLQFHSTKIKTIFLANQNKFVTLILLAYIFMSLTWLVALSSKIAVMNNNFSTYTTPWYAWPIRLGVPGFLAVLSLFLKETQYRRYRNFFILFSIFSISISIGSIYLPTSFSSIGNVLYLEITWIGICALAGLTISRMINPQTARNTLFVSFFISIVLVSGFSSTLIAVQQNATFPDLSSAQLAALQFLKDNKNPNSTVLTFTADSTELITSFANVLNAKQTIPSALSPLLAAKSPDPVLEILNQSNVQFIYLGQDDISLLNSPAYNTSFVTWLTQNLPIAFENDQVKILSFPSLSFPSRQGSTLLISPLESLGDLNYLADSYYKIVLSLSLAQRSFDVRLPADMGNLSGASNVVMTFDPTLQNQSFLTIFSGGNTSQWQTNAGIAKISNQSQGLLNGNQELFVNFSGVAGPENLSRVVYNLEPLIDLSHYETLSMQVKSSYNSIIDVNVMDVNRNWRRWLVPAMKGNWIDLSIAMNNYTSGFGPIDLSRTESIIVGYYNASVPSIMEIGQIIATGNPEVISPIQSAILTNFVSQGGNLTIIAPSQEYFGLLGKTLNLHFESKQEVLPGIDNETLNVEISEIGNGTIKYCNSDDLFSLVNNKDQNERAAILSAFFSLINESGSQAIAKVPETPPYWGHTAELFASGQVEISTDFLKPVQADMQCSVANFTDSKVILNSEIPAADLLWRNVTINLQDSFTITSSRISASECRIEPNGVGQYSILNLKTATWFFSLAEGSRMTVTAKLDDGHQLDFVVTGGSVVLNLPNSEFDVGSFNCHVEGVMNLSKAFFAWPPQNIEASGENLSIAGSSQIFVEHADGTILAPTITIGPDSAVSRQSTPTTTLSSEDFSLGEIQIIIVFFLLFSAILIFLTKRIWASN